MVGLVVVSHSRSLAESVLSLAGGVVTRELPLACAGGAGEDHRELGTDVTDIMEAIQKVYSPEGVLVLMDLGSAVLSARMAADMLEDACPNVRLCPAPLVEGAVAAAVGISIGASLDQVYAEAKDALAAKRQDTEPAESDGAARDGQLPSMPGLESASRDIPADALCFRFTIHEPGGLHLRPASALIRILAAFQATAALRGAASSGPFVNAASLNKLALAGIRQGDAVEMAFWGAEAAVALEAVKRLVEKEFGGRAGMVQGETVRAGTGQGGQNESPAPVSSGIPAVPVCLAPGLALGRLRRADRGLELLSPRTTEQPEEEVARLDAAVHAAREILRAAASSPGTAAGGDGNAIFAAQLLILDDAYVLDQVRSLIRKERCDAASVYQKTMLDLAGQYRSAADPYMRERASDVMGIARLVLDALDRTAATPATAAPEDHSDEEGDFVLDGVFGTMLSALMPEVGLINLAYWDNGFRQFTNSKREVHRWEDMEGMNIRVMQNNVYLDTFANFGANAIPMSVNEMLPALETGALDAQENPFVAIYTNKAYEVQKYVSVTNHAFTPFMLLFSKPIWDKLSEDDHTALYQCALVGQEAERRVNRAMGEDSRQKIADAGLIITEITPEEHQRMAEKSRAVYEKYLDAIGRDVYAALVAELEKFRKQ